MRVVFDTNTVLSALLFQTGRLARLRQRWRQGTVVPVVSRDLVEELLRSLAYPRLALARADQEELLGAFLPYAEVFDGVASTQSAPMCRDAACQMIVDLACAAGVDVVVTRNQELLHLEGEVPVQILTPAELHHHLLVAKT